MSTIEQKEKNLNQLISKLNSLTLTYSQPTYEVEKIKTEKNEILRQKIEIENKNQELIREHTFLREKIKKLQCLTNVDILNGKYVLCNCVKVFSMVTFPSPLNL